MDKEQNELLSLDEVSAYLKISKSTLYKLSQRNKIPSVKIGKQLRFRKSILDQWLVSKEGRLSFSPGTKSVIIDNFTREDKRKSHKGILLVDDDDLVLRTLGRLLHQYGYLVESASNGEIALAKAKAKHFDLIIADVRMPGINGIETIKRLREFNQERARQASAEILITGFMDTQAHQEAKRLGVTDFVYKPFAIGEFIEVVNNKLKTGSK